MSTEQSTNNADGAVTAFRWITLGLVLLTTVSGVWLVFFYQPSPGQAWDLPVDGDITASGLIRTIHNLSSWLTLAAGLGWLVRSTMRRGRTLFRVIPGLVLTGVALGTGIVLPWDQVALRSITVGADRGGFVSLLDDDVVFVLSGGVERSPASILFILAGHVLVGAVLGFLIVRLARRNPST